jgi:hypothetical protein
MYFEMEEEEEEDSEQFLSMGDDDENQYDDTSLDFGTNEKFSKEIILSPINIFGEPSDSSNFDPSDFSKVIPLEK